MFSTVYTIIKNELEKFLIPEDKLIFFTADEPSRIKLYNRFPPIVSQILGPDWKEHHTGNGIYRWIKTQQLNELGNRPFRHRTKFFTNYAAKFKVPELKMVVDFYRTESDSKSTEPNTVNIEFSINDRYSISGEGNEFSIFSTLANIIDHELLDFLERAGNIKHVEFTSSYREPKRTGFYQRRAISFISKILGPNWQFGSYIDPDRYMDRVFRWTKNQ